MTMTEQSGHDADNWGPRVKLTFLVFAAIGGFLLIAEHRAHVLPFLPFVIIAACPLMHLFMHGGHGRHGGHRGSGCGDKPRAGSASSSGPVPEAPRDGKPGSKADNARHCEGQP
jgi:hypothetical protein